MCFFTDLKMIYTFFLISYTYAMGFFDVYEVDLLSYSLTLSLDDMGHRIDDLEKNIGDLMIQAGVEETDK